MRGVAELEAVTGKGVAGCARYFEKSSPRQVTLIEREQLLAHAQALGLEHIAPGNARSNIETEGICLSTLLGYHIEVGGALLHVHELRTPCEQMDAVAPGLRALMKDGKQGVIATVVRGGTIREGDPIRSADPSGLV